MANAWTPHGIITDPRLEMPYREARLSVASQGNEDDPKNHDTIHLFENVFNRVLFADDDFFVNSQVPWASRKDEERACDIAVTFGDGDRQHEIFCFAEAGSVQDTTHKIQNLEKLALDYCADSLAANSKAACIYACTLVGATVRCWSLRRGDRRLEPFWGDCEAAANYLDIGEDSHKETLVSTFEAMQTGGSTRE